MPPGTTTFISVPDVADLFRVGLAPMRAARSRISLQPEMSVLPLIYNSGVNAYAIVTHKQVEVMRISQLHFQAACGRMHAGVADSLIPDAVCIGYQKHVRLRTEDRAQSFTKDWMILHGQNANRLFWNHPQSLRFFQYCNVFLVYN